MVFPLQGPRPAAAGTGAGDVLPAFRCQRASPLQGEVQPHGEPCAAADGLYCLKKKKFKTIRFLKYFLDV